MKEIITNKRNMITNLIAASIVLNLHLFDGPGNNTTESSDLSAEMKTFYSDYLIDVVTPYLVHDQWAQKRPIPKNKGKIVEFRRYSSLPKALTPLIEGVTPVGEDLKVSTVEARVYQYGSWIPLTDMLLLTAIDNNMVEAINLLGDQAGRTLDTITREILNGGTNVFYAPAGDDEVKLRNAITPDCKMSVDLTFRAATHLRAMNAKPASEKDYIAIIHPNVAYDIMRDPEWIDAQKHVHPEKIYDGEIGKMGQVRYVSTSEAKIWRGDDLSSTSRELTAANTTASSSVTITGTTLTPNALKDRYVLINGYKYKVKSNTASALNLVTVSDNGTEANASITASAGTKIYPGEGGAEGISVYSSIVLGKNAYGTTEITGGGLEHIVCQLGSAGAADPLKQRASAGWKATKAACRLVEEYMVRIESSATQANYAAN